MNDEEKIMEKRSSFRGWKERNRGKIPQHVNIIVISLIILFFSALIIYPYLSGSEKSSKVNPGGKGASSKANNAGKIGGSVISPNGGENWMQGTTHSIRWNPSVIPGKKVKIELLKNGSLAGIIRQITLNDGSENWTISPTGVLGNNFKIRIRSTINMAVNDISNNNFAISRNLSLTNSTPDAETPPVIGQKGIPLVSKDFVITVKDVTSSAINTNVGLSIRNTENMEKPLKIGQGTVILDNIGQQYENIHPARTTEISQANLSAGAIREGNIFFEKLEDDRTPDRLILNINEEKFEFMLDISDI